MKMLIYIIKKKLVKTSICSKYKINLQCKVITWALAIINTQQIKMKSNNKYALLKTIRKYCKINKLNLKNYNNSNNFLKSSLNK